MINLVCIDGGSGSLRGSKLGLRFKLMLKIYGDKQIKVSYLRSSFLPIVHAIRKWRARKRVLKYNDRENTLILAGKSLGAIWVMNMLSDLDLAYRRVYLCTIDPHDPVNYMVRYGLNAPALTKGWNVYQSVDRPRGGMIGDIRVQNEHIIRAGVDHWNIIFSSEASDAVVDTLRAAIKSQ